MVVGSSEVVVGGSVVVVVGLVVVVVVGRGGGGRVTDTGGAIVGRGGIDAAWCRGGRQPPVGGGRRGEAGRRGRRRVRDGGPVDLVAQDGGIGRGVGGRSDQPHGVARRRDDR